MFRLLVLRPARKCPSPSELGLTGSLNSPRMAALHCDGWGVRLVRGERARLLKGRSPRRTTPRRHASHEGWANGPGAPAWPRPAWRVSERNTHPFKVRPVPAGPNGAIHPPGPAGGRSSSPAGREGVGTTDSEFYSWHHVPVEGGAAPGHGIAGHHRRTSEELFAPASLNADLLPGHAYAISTGTTGQGLRGRPAQGRLEAGRPTCWPTSTATTGHAGGSGGGQAPAGEGTAGTCAPTAHVMSSRCLATRGHRVLCRHARGRLPHANGRPGALLGVRRRRHAVPSE